MESQRVDFSTIEDIYKSHQKVYLTKIHMQKGREELLHVQGQEGRPWGDAPPPR